MPSDASPACWNSLRSAKALQQDLLSPWSNLQAQVFFLQLRGFLAHVPVALDLVHRYMRRPLIHWAASEHGAAGGAAG